MNKLVIMLFLLFSVCPIYSHAAAKSIELSDMPASNITMKQEKNELYTITTASVLAKNSNKELVWNEFSEGSSKTSYETFVKKLPGVVKAQNAGASWFIGFGSQVQYKDSKKAVIELATIKDPNVFMDFWDLDYEVFTVYNHGKYGVTFSRRKTDLDFLNTGNGWYTIQSGKFTHIYFDRIFKDLNESYLPKISADIQKKIDTSITLKGIEQKYSQYSLEKDLSTDDLSKRKMFIPYISLAKNSGKVTYTIEVNSMSNNYFPQPIPVGKVNRVFDLSGFKKTSTKSYDFYQLKSPYYYGYSEIIMVKSKDGKYWFPSMIVLRKWQNDNPLLLKDADVRPFINDLSILRSEVAKMLASFK